MKGAFIADVPWWCLHRDGDGVARYHGTRHSWDVYHQRHPSDYSADVLEQYDLVRWGCVPLFLADVRDSRLPRRPRLVVSVASFSDPEALHSSIVPWDRIAGIVFNDMRQAADVSTWPVRSYYLPGKIADDDWAPMPQLRPAAGPLRVGWAGSEFSWPGVKRRDMLAQACAEAGVTFVRQDRELDGCLLAKEMLRWYSRLDLYVSVNVELSCTPVTTLEAVRCGVPVMTTKCGELWPFLQAVDEDLVVDGSPNAVAAGLRRLAARGREHLRRLGDRLRSLSGYVCWGESGVARQATEVLASWARPDL